jgi:hypothetical protein
MCQEQVYVSHSESPVHILDARGTFAVRPLPAASECLKLAVNRVDSCPRLACLLWLRSREQNGHGAAVQLVRLCF